MRKGMEEGGGNHVCSSLSYNRGAKRPGKEATIC